MLISEVATSNVRRIGQHTVELELFMSSMRGMGRQEYSRLEASLPEDIHLVELDAVDSSDGFWIKMGFSPKFVGDEDDIGSLVHVLWKGVNGHPTPAPREPTDEDLDQ